MDKAQEVFDHWNSKGRGGGWHSHSIFSAEIEDAVKIRLKVYSVGQLKSAIDNYALILLSSDYRMFNNGKSSWDKKWTLRQFLLRRPNNFKEVDPYLYRFLPGTFEASEYLTKQARERRKVISEPQPSPKPPKPITPEDKAYLEEQKRKFWPVRKESNLTEEEIEQKKKQALEKIV